jgi:hypothetical protein
MIGISMAKSTKQSGAADPAKLERQRLNAPSAGLCASERPPRKRGANIRSSFARLRSARGERQFQQDGIDWLEGRDTDGARRIAVIIDQKKKAVVASRIVTPLTPVKPSRLVRKAEASEFDRKRASVKDAVVDVGTGQTILKLRQKAIPKLVDQGKIGARRNCRLRPKS